MTTHVDDLDLPFIDLGSAAFVTDPYPILRAAQDRHWLARSDFGVHVLSYDGVHAALRDKRFRFAGAELYARSGSEHADTIIKRSRRNLLHLHGEAHTRLRRFVSRAFTPRSVDRVRPAAVALFDRLLDPVCERGACEFVHDVTRPYPVQMICALLGTPVDEWEQFSDWVEVLFGSLNFNLEEDAPQIVQAQQDLDDYLRRWIDEKRAEPGDDLLSDLIAVQNEDGDRLSTDDIAVLAENTLTAGTDTTRNELASGVHDLATNPDQMEALRADAELVPNAVEEMLRFRPVVGGTLRFSDEDVEIDDVMFPSGTVVIPTMTAANRDATVYADPDRFDVTRDFAQPPQSFGGGAHFCIGAALARAELQEALRAILDRMPEIEITGEVRWKPIVGIGGPEALPIRFEPGH